MDTQTPHKNIVPRTWFEETVRGLPVFTDHSADIRCTLEHMDHTAYRVFLVGNGGARTSDSRLVVEFDLEGGYDWLTNPRVSLRLEKKLFDGFAVNGVEATHPRESELATLRRPQRDDLELAAEIAAELSTLCLAAEQIGRKVEGYAATHTAA